MKKVLFLFILFLTLGAVSTSQAFADASMTLSPSSGNYTVNGTFDVSVIMDTGGAQSSGSDFILTWSPASLIEIQTASDVSYGSAPLFTSNTPSRDNTNGKIISISTMNVATSTYSGKGTLATMKFKAKSTGTVTLRFECTAGSRSDTNIWSSGSDVINCDQSSGGSYNITSGSTGATATPAPIGAPATAVPGTGTKGGLPNSGAFEVTLALGVGGALLLAFGFFFPKLLKS